MAAVPDHPTAGRWCKDCSAFLPLEQFPEGDRRFKCKMHIWHVQRALREKKKHGDPVERALYVMWNYAYADSRAAFLGSRPAPEPGEPVILIKSEIDKLCQRSGLQPSRETRVVPIDASNPLRLENAAVVTRKSREILVKIWRVSRDVDMYTAALNSCRLGTPDSQRMDLPDVETLTAADVRNQGVMKHGSTQIN
jgi:hypothetical protein